MKSQHWVWFIFGCLIIICTICLIPSFIEDCNKSPTDQAILQIISKQYPPPIRTNVNTGERCPPPTIKLTIIYPNITGKMIHCNLVCIYEDAYIGILTTDVIHGDWFTIDELRNIPNLHWVIR